MALDLISASITIELAESNMFANGRILVFADGTSKLVRDRVKYEPTEPDDYYTVKIGDMITKIAYDYYKDKVELPQHYWWMIADANNHIGDIIIRNPLDLSMHVGKEIIVPNILNFKLKN